MVMVTVMTVAPGISRCIGSQVTIVDQVEEPLDQVSGFSLLGLGECHVIILPDEGCVRNSLRANSSGGGTSGAGGRVSRATRPPTLRVLHGPRRTRRRARPVGRPTTSQGRRLHRSR
jgi:hypothetical protein